ncbi:MAG: stage II sporulation protein M [Verrucomicrobia bacterium]|nr:stage II sporulation protein M [Verrucomicrobiota bacterium]
MILDLARFIERERPAWEELDRRLARVESDPYARLELDDIRRLHQLYERAAADLADIRDLATEPELRGMLESLVARAYAEIHTLRTGVTRFNPWRWFTRTFPRTFRARARYFAAATIAMTAGVLFGGGVLLADGTAKRHLLPFEHLQGDPADRVAQEEKTRDTGDAALQTFSAQLMTNNIRVSILALALGIAFGAGTLVLMFFNGVILGAVCADYLAAGQGVFLAGWLLPHGSIEIPAVLIAGQAGLLLGRAAIGWGDRRTMKVRLSGVLGDLVTLVGGCSVLLVWAGLVESFFSQVHEPVLPYALKIAIGMAELAGLALFLALSGRAPAKDKPEGVAPPAQPEVAA